MHDIFSHTYELHEGVPILLHSQPNKQISVSTRFFTITAQILTRSLPNFYRQQADRHTNLHFFAMRQQARAIWQFVIAKNKWTSVFHASVLLLTMNFVITLSK